MEKKLVLCKRRDFKGLNQFWKEINDLYKEGYVALTADLSKTIKIKDSPSMGAIMKVCMVKPVVESKPKSEPEPEPASKPSEAVPNLDALELLQELTKKADMLELASEQGIEVPKDKKTPAAIKKFLKAQLA